MTPIIKDKVQLAKTTPVDRLTFPCYGEMKPDGVRCLAFIGVDGSVELYTRAGHRINSPNLENCVAESFPIVRTPFMLDGELALNEGRMGTRTQISGMVNSAIKGGCLDNLEGITYYIFDFMKREHFDSKWCTEGYESRLAQLKLRYIQFYDNVELIERRVLTSATQANNWYEDVVARGFEGLVFKPLDFMYGFKRSKDWSRLKEIKTADIKCVGIKPGNGKYDGMIGSLYCEGLVEGKFVSVSVSGMTDELRGAMDDYFIGSTIEIKYNGVIPNSAGDGYTLFLPRFVEKRFDK
ncbi:MAG: hypothetical protein K0U41_09120 [Gammaproteobacteria bacterium]|nr:hypothetical protein [Gammaproteobacteria bacterium]